MKINFLAYSEPIKMLYKHKNYVMKIPVAKFPFSISSSSTLITSSDQLISACNYLNKYSLLIGLGSPKFRYRKHLWMDLD